VTNQQVREINYDANSASVPYGELKGRFRAGTNYFKLMNTRVSILRILESFDRRPADLERLVDKELSVNPVDHRDRRFVFEIVYGIIRRRLTLDYIIDGRLSDADMRANKHLKRVLEIGFYQLLFMDRVPDHAAVNETVNAAGFDSRTDKLRGIVNGVLRTFIKEKKRVIYPDPSSDLAFRLSIEYSHPQWMISRWLAHFGLSKTKLLCAFNNEKPEIYFRRKIRGLSRQQFETEFREHGSSAGGYLNLYYRSAKPFVPDDLKLFTEGDCTVQAPSSGWITALLDVQKNDVVLDVCSAPGGKTALMAELAGDQGLVFACEKRKNRIELVRDTLHRMALGNVVMVLCDGQFLPFAGKFHKILLDAPCSGTGVLHRHPEGRFVKTAEDFARLTQLQATLLSGAAGQVAPGGILVYSTCSLEPEENENQIDAFLKTHPEFVLDPPPSSIPATYISSSGFVTITPCDHKLDGMFGARLKKMTEK
jgi:16S rRNA (cytosine967-C5)-methyltransferase